MFNYIIEGYKLSTTENIRYWNDYIWVCYSNIGILPLILVNIFKFFEHDKILKAYCNNFKGYKSNWSDRLAFLLVISLINRCHIV